MAPAAHRALRPLRFLAVLGLALPALAAAAGPASPEAPGGPPDAEVEAGGTLCFATLYALCGFTPADLRVPVGATVRWVNAEVLRVPHNVVADDGSFASPDLLPGDAFEHTFAAAGSWEYYCTYHGPMWARVAAG